MIKIIFNEPRGGSTEELFRWALETTEKLNRIQSVQSQAGSKEASDTSMNRTAVRSSGGCNKIVNEGETAGWHYRKYANGVMEQWKTVGPVNLSSWDPWSTANEYLIVSDPVSIDYGIPFANEPCVNISTAGGTWAMPLINEVHENNFSVMGVRQSAAGSDKTYYFAVHAIGLYT